MFSQKTTKIIQKYRKFKSLNIKSLIINYLQDNRYGNDDYVYTHNKDREECIKIEKLSDIDNNIIMDNQVIFINEGQFFDDLVEYCKLWCDKYNKTIYVCGLDGDFKRNSFGNINHLISIADNFKKLKGKCEKCHDKSIFTGRINNNKEQKLIGSDMYIPLCRKCYLSFSN